jgi:hypothetical protein
MTKSGRKGVSHLIVPFNYCLDIPALSAVCGEAGSASANDIHNRPKVSRRRNFHGRLVHQPSFILGFAKTKRKG